MIIYDSNGRTVLNITVDDNSYGYEAIMGDHNIVLRYSLAEHVEIPVGASFIQHLTLGITALSSSHSGYKVWSLPAFTSAQLIDGSKKYYLYAKCSQSAQTGDFILSETAYSLDTGGYYYLLVGVLNSEYDGVRWLPRGRRRTFRSRFLRNSEKLTIDN